MEAAHACAGIHRDTYILVIPGTQPMLRGRWGPAGGAVAAYQRAAGLDLKYNYLPEYKLIVWLDLCKEDRKCQKSAAKNAEPLPDQRTYIAGGAVLSWLHQLPREKISRIKT